MLAEDVANELVDWSNAAGLESALAAGVDVVVHTAPAMETWSDSLVGRMVKADVCRRAWISSARSVAREARCCSAPTWATCWTTTRRRSSPARRFGLEKTAGRIAPGMEADLVVLVGDPASDLGALGRVRYTLRQGRIIYRRDGSESQ